MAQKKNWLEIESLNCVSKTKSNKFDISWSSSSSDVEDVNYKYRKKVRRNDKIKNINYIRAKGETTPTKLDDCSQDMSPIIGQSLLESPITNETSCDKIDGSPVIGRNQLLAKWKQRKSKKICSSFNDKFKLLNTQSEKVDQNDIPSYSSSVELSKKNMQLVKKANKIPKFPSEPKYNDINLIQSISETSSDIFSQVSEKICIDCSSPTNSENDLSPVISQFSSRQTSRKSSKSDCNSVGCFSSTSSDITSSNKSIMYHIIPQKKKRKSKKGQLAKQLEKALKNKECNISMWQHELYLGKIDFCEDILHLLVFQIFEEFGCKICMCHFISPEAEKDCDKKCILVLNLSIHQIVKCFQPLKVYKPYSMSSVNYCEENYCCYYNICKILFDV